MASKHEMFDSTEKFLFPKFHILTSSADVKIGPWLIF